MKIAIVNDLPMAVEALRRVLALRPEHHLVWVAENGAEAVQRCSELRPDLILMDLLMPEMDGVEATRRIMSATPCAILLVTADMGALRGQASGQEPGGHVRRRGRRVIGCVRYGSSLATASVNDGISVCV
jgi:chemotaxis response regulator CheB